MGMEGADGFRPTTLGCGTMATVQQEGKGNQYQNIVRLRYKIPCFFSSRFRASHQEDIVLATLIRLQGKYCVTVSPSPQSQIEEEEKLHVLQKYARDFRCYVTVGTFTRRGFGFTAVTLRSRCVGLKY
jgi:hypothetical protein